MKQIIIKYLRWALNKLDCPHAPIMDEYEVVKIHALHLVGRDELEYTRLSPDVIKEMTMRKLKQKFLTELEQSAVITITENNDIIMARAYHMELLALRKKHAHI